jgi:hypothetical protein
MLLHGAGSRSRGVPATGLGPDSPAPRSLFAAQVGPALAVEGSLMSPKDPDANVLSSPDSPTDTVQRKQPKHQDLRQNVVRRASC